MDTTQLLRARAEPSFHPPVLSGYVSRRRAAPTTFEDPMWLIAPNHTENNPYGPCSWPAIHGGTLPIQGSPVTFVLDDQGAPVITWWAGTYSLPEPLAQLLPLAGLRSARPAASAVYAGATYYATDNGITYQSNGTSTWTAISWQTLRVTSLPSSPTPEDGQRIAYVADATNGLRWEFEYRSASASSSKWEFVGGSPLTAENAGSFSTSTTIHQYTKDVNVTVPFAGDYMIEVGCDAWWATAACFLQVANLVNAETAAATAADAETVYLVPSGDTTRMPATRRRHTARTLAANDVVNASFASGTTGVAATVDHRWIQVTPVRVG